MIRRANGTRSRPAEIIAFSTSGDIDITCGIQRQHIRRIIAASSQISAKKKRVRGQN